MDDNEFLAEQFEEHRAHLRAVAYRMLGSLSEADDAVQEAWLRLARSDAKDVENLGGWLTTVAARVCLNMLRSRASRREEPLDVHIPDPVVSRASGLDPEQEALLADSVGLALLTVLEIAPARGAARIRPARHVRRSVREIAGIVGRTPAAARQLASRGRRRVQAAPTTPDPDVGRQREVVDAFFAASRAGDFERLVAVLDPDVVLALGRRCRLVVPRGVRGAGRSPGARSRSARLPRTSGRCSSTEPPASSWRRRGVRSRSWPSPSPTAASSRSTRSPTPTG